MTISGSFVSPGEPKLIETGDEVKAKVVVLIRDTIPISEFPGFPLEKM
jgi:hypothetical protein